MGVNTQHCSFVLLAEFDIDRGAQLTYQFPQPLGTDEGLLANLMLPDGAEKHLEDWTIFFLNQTSFNKIAPVLALETPERAGKENKSELLYVLNLVRTKHDKTVRRGAVVKAMAICTPHPFIQIFKPVLLLALDDYFSSPSQDCLARLFDAINSMDLSAAPILTRAEKLIMRHSERKDVFIEKFTAKRASEPSQHRGRVNHRPTASVGSHSSFDEGVIIRTKDSMDGRGRASSDTSVRTASVSRQNGSEHSSSETSFSLGGSAVWVGDEGGSLEHSAAPGVSSSYGSHGGSATARSGRKSTDASSNSSHGQHTRPPLNTGTSEPRLVTKDTHYYHTTINYKGHQLPIKMPLFTFPQEVGDYSLIQLIQTFSTATISGPLHPHLNSNGSLTHPITLLFNALVTGKRIIFLGHNRPAGEVSSYVLSACALGSGCGIILRGFIERAFPYANLTNRDEWESVPAYIAGVTNPIFESSGSWDLLCDVGGGRMIVSRDMHSSHPLSGVQAGPPSMITRTGTLKAESSIGSEDDLGRTPGRENQAQKSDIVAKADSADNVFIEDIITAINFHFGESLVRARFVEYVWRFVRLASRYEEDILGTTTIGFPGISFNEGPGDTSQLGSGTVFLDDAAGSREVLANASRIEGWRRTAMYPMFQEDFKRSLATSAIRGFDINHQLWRLRNVKHMPDAEVELIMRTMVNSVQTYNQVVEVRFSIACYLTSTLLALTPPHNGGLLPLSFGLFHQQEVTRDLTVDLFTQLRMFPVGVQFLQALNHFQRYAYVRQARARESRGVGPRDTSGPGLLAPPTFSRTPTHRSELNSGAG
ncbi:spindle pole body interacting protein [Multifurca ochricompacta]|uniref:Spindle pole body interacting protein n=1 Tax=Multifurca ochricompacta TaxID=376703 RepID=A0AAD4M4K0_9AGAM|nr:spindle pole body interacting protein [Multifurca ochricompacta]